MKCYKWHEREMLDDRPRAVALGVFDGLHIGHRAVITEACGKVQGKTPLTATVLSMTGVPKFHDGLLLAPSVQKTILHSLGTDEYIELPFASVSSMMPEQFVQEVLCNFLHAKCVCCGYNYHFGKGGVGNAELLRELCEARGVTVKVVGEVASGDLTVSSTAIRKVLKEGDMQTALRLLGRPFTVAFPVTSGAHRGRTWGMPTINQVFPSDYAVPRFGVYASLVVIDGVQYQAVTNVGVHPSVGGTLPQAETWIQDFEGDLYGQAPAVELVHFLRDERRFDSVDALRAQMMADAERAKAVLAGADGMKAVLFDFDDTLQDRFAAITWVAERLLTRHLRGVDVATIKAYAHEMAVANNGGYVDYDSYFEHFVSKWPFDVTADVLKSEYRREMPYGSKLYDEAKAVLAALRSKGYRLGIVTNGWADMQHRKIDVSGIRPYVDLVCVSGEEGIKKPDAAIFKRTAARLGVAPENCTFVGDHPINDIAGALSAGMNAIYLNTRDLPCDADVPEMLKLGDVLDVL